MTSQPLHHQIYAQVNFSKVNFHFLLRFPRLQLSGVICVRGAGHIDNAWRVKSLKIAFVANSGAHTVHSSVFNFLQKHLGIHLFSKH